VVLLVGLLNLFVDLLQGSNRPGSRGAHGGTENTTSTCKYFWGKMY